MEKEPLVGDGNLMGINATAVIMHDALGDIERDPEFGAKLSRACTNVYVGRGSADVSAHGFVNAVTVLENHHSSMMRPVWVGGNTGIVQDVLVLCDLLKSQENSDVKLLRAVAAELGYRIVKRKK